MSNDLITLEQVQQALPANLKRAATQEMADTLNGIVTDPMIAEIIRDNFVSYTGVLKDGKFKTEDYIHAVSYVSFKLMGDSNKEAWCKTFPSRHATLAARGASEKEISAHVAAYNKGQLVNKILEQSMVPTWVLNQNLFQKAINTQAEIMLDPDVSAKVRSDAANSLMTHLKKPDAVKAEIDLNVKDATGMNEMRTILGDMARQQQELMRHGTPIKTITDSVIIDNEDTKYDGAD